MKQVFFLVLLLISQLLLAQDLEKNNTIIKIDYSEYSNGKKVDNTEISVKYSDQILYLSEPNSKIRYFMDYKLKRNISLIKYEDKLYYTQTPFDSLIKPKELDNDEERILGHDCKIATFSYFSNTIKVWYTEETEAKGSPYSRYIPSCNCLVLKIVVNGNHTLIAGNIEKLEKQELQDYPLGEAKEISESEFEELKIKSRYKSLSVFENETINFDPEIEVVKSEELELNKTYHFSKGTIILKKIKLPELNKKGGYVFAKLYCKSKGDAYDRTGSVFILQEEENKISVLDALLNGIEILPKYLDNEGKEYQGIVASEKYNPPVEIMRFFTSFGVDHFNKLREINNYPWKDNAEYNQEVTKLFPSSDEEIWVGVFIGNYDKGGHEVSLELNFYPPWEEKEVAEKFIKPLFSTVNIMEMSGQNYGKLFKNDTLELKFEVPENANDLELLFTSTGHGGWENGDEFNPKLNKIFIDEKEVFKIIPWRTDCATYRLFNPASGNFGNGQSSSDLSRSNWCPATLTPPYFIKLNNLEKGTHTMKIIIDQGDDEGTSFNHWSISGILVGTLTK